MSFNKCQIEDGARSTLPKKGMPAGTDESEFTQGKNTLFKKSPVTKNKSGKKIRGRARV